MYITPLDHVARWHICYLSSFSQSGVGWMTCSSKTFVTKGERGDPITAPYQSARRSLGVGSRKIIGTVPQVLPAGGLASRASPYSSITITASVRD